MKIICTSCNKVLGEQTPFDSSSKIYAKCTDCINKAKEEAAKFKSKPRPGEKQEVTLENGLKGTLWVPGNKKEKLSLDELVVSGKKFYCAKDKLEEFQKYLGKIKSDEVEVIFLHSMSVKLDTPLKGRKKKEAIKTEEKKNKSIDYNCTMKAPKYYAQLMFNSMAERNQRVVEMIAEAAIKAYQKEQEEALNKAHGISTKRDLK